MIPVHLLFIPLVLALSAMFAAAEASLFSLSRVQMESLRQTRPHLYHRIRLITSHPENLLSTLVVGNECLNIMLGTLVAGLLEMHFSSLTDSIQVVLSVLVSSILMLAFSEILPKIFAFRFPLLTSSALILPISFVSAFLKPLRVIFIAISNQITRLFGIGGDPSIAVSEKDLLTMVEVGEQSGSLNRDEKQMIINVFHFSDQPVSSIMTPWKQVSRLSSTVTPVAALQFVREKTYSRIPVVNEKEDRVVGVLYTKELLKLLIRQERERESSILDIQDAIFPPYIVSSHKKIAKLFREFKQKKVHIALVVDEYGKHTGVVTLEDILNSLFQTQKKADNR